MYVQTWTSSEPLEKPSFMSAPSAQQYTVHNEGLTSCAIQQKTSMCVCVFSVCVVYEVCVLWLRVFPSFACTVCVSALLKAFCVSYPVSICSSLTYVSVCAVCLNPLHPWRLNYRSMVHSLHWPLVIIGLSCAAWPLSRPGLIACVFFTHQHYWDVCCTS